MMMDGNNNSPRDEPLITGFFEGKTVFITGATGYCGKYLVYNLLLTCDVKTIYILLRGKRGKSFEERLQSYLQEEIFTYLPQKDVLQKIVALEGDITLPSLGLNDQDYESIISNVNLVYHCAASVKFSEPLKAASNLQVKATRTLLELALKMESLLCFIHLSTFMAWQMTNDMEERIYPFAVDPDSWLKEVEGMSVKEVEKKLVPRYLGNQLKFNNSYFFTKTMTEVLLKKYSGRIKIVCARLPYLTFAQSLPCPGWFDTLQFGNTAFVAFAGGLLRTVGFDPQDNAECLPGDCAANALVTIGWSEGRRQGRDFKVINIGFERKDGPTIYQVLSIARDVGLKYPSIRQILPPSEPSAKRPTPFYLYIESWFMFFIGYFTDLFLVFNGKKAMISKTLQNLYQTNVMAVNLQTQIRKHRVDTMNNLYDPKGPICDSERELFYFNGESVDWTNLFTEGYFRFRRNILKEPDSNIPKAVERLNSIAAYFKPTKLISLLVAFLVISPLVLIPTIL